MKTKGFLGLLAVVCLSLVTSCNSISSTAGTGNGGFIAGSYTSSEKGFGGDVSITVEVSDKKILKVVGKGDKETPGIGSKAIEALPEKILKAQSADIDGVTGATYSSNALLSAAKASLRKARGVKAGEASLSMKPGTYTGRGQGFRLFENIEVSVSVGATSITAIDVGKDNGETKPILQSVIDKMVPRMIERQSIQVDGITGATATGNAVRTAVAEALGKALKAGGSSADAIEAFKVKAKKADGKIQIIDTEILVVGMGGSGIAAATRAAEIVQEKKPKSVRILAVDKAGKYGGTSSVTSEMFAVNAPEFQQKFNGGKEYVNKDQLRRAWLAYTEGDAKEEMVDLLLDNSGKVVDWLMFKHGFQFSTPKRGFTAADVYEVKYQYLPNNTGTKEYAKTGAYFDGIVKDYTALGGKYLLETEVYGLLYDKKSNTVKGVKARAFDGSEYEIRAEAVILASGGFAGNGDMETKYLSNKHYPLSGKWNQYGMRQNDGKMIASAIDLGAGTYNIGIPPMVHVAGTPAFLTKFEKNTISGVIGRMTGRPAVWSSGDIPLNMVIAANSLAVDSKGERFTSEVGVGMLDPWKAGPRYYSIWSTDRIREIKEKGFRVASDGPGTGYLGHQTAIPANTPLPNAYEVLDAAVEAGFVYKADTLEGLAKLINVKADTLTKTVSTYNEYCEAGKDPAFNKPAKFLEKIGAGPYYAVVGTPYCYSTCGGLNIDRNFKVLQAD
ncbi:MAG: FMN-binding protein, partial [Treponemataceae bacterium]